MKITVIEPGFELISPLNGLIELVERAGRVCYKSEDRITNGSAAQFVRAIRKSGHYSVLEHASISVVIWGDRAMSHQLVRHRIGVAFSQESQRYVNYGKKGFQVVSPPSIGVPAGEYYIDEKTFNDDKPFIYEAENCKVYSPLKSKHHYWLKHRFEDYLEYLVWLKEGIPPEDARSCLPNATKTELATTFNLRQWRHVFEERALNKQAQWQIKGIMQNILRLFALELPCVFEDQLEALNAS